MDSSIVDLYTLIVLFSSLFIWCDTLIFYLKTE